MMNMAEVRKKYPQYNDLSDKELADALHKQFYSDMPKADFYSAIGLPASAPPPLLERPPEKPPTQYSGLTALMLGQGPDMSIGERAKDIGKSVVRSGGLLARNLISGVEGAADFLGMPLRAAPMFAGHPDPAGGSSDIADLIGLPQPQGAIENVISEAEKLVGSGTGLLGVANKASKASGVTGNVMKAMTQRPDLQLASMVSAGTAGGATKELGGGPLAQFFASLGGGLLGPVALNSAQRAAQMSSPAINAKITEYVESQLRQRGISMNDISIATRNAMFSDIKKALTIGDLDDAQMARLIDYRILGAKPTMGPITQDPGVITKQKNLAAQGAASRDARLQELSQVANKNNQLMTQKLNDLGANTVDDAYSAGAKVANSLGDIDDRVYNHVIKPLYEAADNAGGGNARLSPAHFAQRANDLLDEKLVGGKLPTDVRNHLNMIATGDEPFTIRVAEQLKTRIGELQRSTVDKQERLALGLVRQALDDTPLIDGYGQKTIDAYNKARAANRDWMRVVEKTPALQAVRDGIEPDKFMQNYVIGNGANATVAANRNLKNVLDRFDEGSNAVVRGMFTNYLKDKAKSGAADEIVNFSQAGYNRALKSIGDAKLGVWFTKDELELLKMVGRVASYEQAQPVGSAVNNSNSANTAISGLLDWLGGRPVLRHIPVGGSFLADELGSAAANMQAGRMLTPGPVVVPAVTPQRNIWPYAGAGLLAIGSKNDQRN